MNILGVEVTPNLFLGILILYMVIYIIFWIIKDRVTDYNRYNLKFRTKIIDGQNYLTIVYRRKLERRKLEYILNIKPGSEYGNLIILEYVSNYFDKYSFKCEALFRYVTRVEWEKKNPHIGTYINQNVENSRGNISLQAPTGNTINYVKTNIEQWNEEIYTNNGMSADDKVLLNEVLIMLKQDRKVDENMAKKCINILSGMNTMFTFGKNLIEILTRFL